MSVRASQGRGGLSGSSLTRAGVCLCMCAVCSRISFQRSLATTTPTTTACRNQAVREEVAEAVRKAMISVKSADISPDNLVVRFSESVDGFPLPKGYSDNPDLAVESKDKGKTREEERRPA